MTEDAGEARSGTSRDAAGESVRAIAERAKGAARELARMTGAERRRMLLAIAESVDAEREKILEANSIDVEEATRRGLAPPLLERMKLSISRIEAIVAGVREVAALPDPVGEVLEETVRPNGLRIRKVRVPIGVIAVIYESRPNVTIDTAALCLASGNAILLRGGSEVRRTNGALVEAAVRGGSAAGLPSGALSIDTSGDRERVKDLVQLEGVIDLVIPRGGEGLIRAVTESARVPVLKHYKGVCHVFVHRDADLEMAVRIVENAKCQRPGVCNALETLLVDEPVAERFLPLICTRLRERNVELRGDERSRQICTDLIPAVEADWETEYLDLILSVKVVPGLAAAIAHIERYGSHHSDAIITTDPEASREFLAEVDSAVVYVNASTRFTDGAEFGMGAEIGISTDKLHARGPMGLRELTTYRYLVEGTGQLRS